MTAARATVAIVLSLFAQASILYYAMHYGTLSGLIQWDDAAVILRGFENLDRLVRSGSIGSLLRATLHLDIHAPLSDLQAIVGLLLSGGQTWAPYALNATWLAIVLSAVLATFERRRWLLAAVAVFFVITQPLTVNALADVKADWSGGLLLAGALFLFAKGADTAQQSLKLAGAGLLGLSCLSKLTAFYLPVVAITVVVLFEWYSYTVRSWHGSARVASSRDEASFPVIARRPLERRAAVLLISIAVGPFLLFFLFKLKATLGYIRSAEGALWQDGLTVIGKARYYSPYGPDSWMEWGNLHIFFFVFVAASLLLAWRRRNYSYPFAVALYAIIATMLFAPLMFSNVTHSFGATFLGVIMAATLLSIDYLVRSLPNWGGVAVGGVTLLIAALAPIPLKTSNYYSTFSTSSTELRTIASTYAQIVDAMVAHSHGEAPDVLVFYDDVFAPHPNIAIEYFQKTGLLPRIDRVDDLSTWSQAGELSNADFALTIVPESGSISRSIPDLFPRYPISSDPGRADELVRAAGFFDALGEFHVPGGEVHLYGKHHL